MPARRLVASIAAFLMLLAAVVPALSHALAAAHRVDWPAAVVCTSDGARVLPAVPGDRAPVAPRAKLLDHCPFCVSHAGAAAPPAATIAAAIFSGADAVPPAFLHAARPLFAWTAAQPRAPPSVC